MSKLKRCKSCGEGISKKAASCPKCGEPNKKKMGFMARGCLGLVLFSVFFVFLINVLIPDQSESETTTGTDTDRNISSSQSDWKNGDYTTTAYRMCEDEVKSKLKAPGTAKFQSLWEGRYDNVVNAGQRYFFKSYVDAQNSFGATIRTRFECSVTQVEKGKWSINKLELLD